MSSMSQKDLNLNKCRQFGEIPNYGDESVIVIPNRITPKELNWITAQISEKNAKYILLADENSNILEELVSEGNENRILTFDFKILLKAFSINDWIETPFF